MREVIHLRTLSQPGREDRERRKANYVHCTVLAGINRYASPNVPSLGGCVNDVEVTGFQIRLEVALCPIEALPILM
jgi:hypothetical protein